MVGLKTHRLNHAKLDSTKIPPWDEFKLLEESWSGMRYALDVATSVVESSQSTTFTYSPIQIKRAVRHPRPHRVGLLLNLCTSSCTHANGTQVHDFVEQKTDLADAAKAWTAYRNIIRMYTNVTLTMWKHGNQETLNTDAPVLSEETSHRSMRHSAVFGDKQVISKSEMDTLTNGANHAVDSGATVGVQPGGEALAFGQTATSRTTPKRRSTKINYSVDEEELEARMDTQL